MSDFAAVNQVIQIYVGRDLSASEAEIRDRFPDFSFGTVPADSIMTLEFEGDRIRAGIDAGRIRWIRVG